MTVLEGFVTVIGMALITLLTRGFFLFPERDVPLPAWFKQGLRYAPLATMAAIVVPEVVLTQGQLIATWQDARLPAVAVATAWFFWRRDILGTILSGTAVLLVLKLVFGW
jgi:branched-subunit amino acid transport protein